MGGKQSIDENLQKLYRNRFDEDAEKKKNTIWMPICKYLKRHFYSEKHDGGVLVDIAAGYCDFSNNFEVEMDKYAFDANPDVEKYAKDSVSAIVDDINNLPMHFRENSISIAFASNFLEHITKPEISRLFQNVYSLLKKGGEFWILTPNLKYVGGKYWDFFDHITPITDESVTELGKLAGFKRKDCIKKFLPFSTKSRLPQMPWLVNAYLHLMPLSGCIMGEQSFIVLEKR